MKGHLVFTGTRLIQRRHIFYNSLLNRVKNAHRVSSSLKSSHWYIIVSGFKIDTFYSHLQKFLVSRFYLSEADLPDDSSLRRWHPAFPLDTAVPEIEPAILPPRPSDGSDVKITSARDAVAVFRARALFKEAKVCEEIAARREQYSPQAKSSNESPDSGVNSPVKNSTATVLKDVSAALLAKVSL